MFFAELHFGIYIYGMFRLIAVIIERDSVVGEPPTVGGILKVQFRVQPRTQGLSLGKTL